MVFASQGKSIVKLSSLGVRDGFNSWDKTENAHSNPLLTSYLQS